MKICNDNNEVIGKIERKYNSWVASWVIPKEYENEGTFVSIGEYNSFDEAQYKLNEFLHKKYKEIEKYKLQDKKENLLFDLLVFLVIIIPLVAFMFS